MAEAGKNKKAILEQIAQLDRLASLAAHDGSAGVATQKDALIRMQKLATQIHDNAILESVQARLAAIPDVMPQVIAETPKIPRVSSGQGTSAYRQPTESPKGAEHGDHHMEKSESFSSRPTTSVHFGRKGSLFGTSSSEKKSWLCSSSGSSESTGGRGSLWVNEGPKADTPKSHNTQKDEDDSGGMSIRSSAWLSSPEISGNLKSLNKRASGCSSSGNSGSSTPTAGGVGIFGNHGCVGGSSANNRSGSTNCCCSGSSGGDRGSESEDDNKRGSAIVSSSGGNNSGPDVNGSVSVCISSASSGESGASSGNSEGSSGGGGSSGCLGVSYDNRSSRSPSRGSVSVSKERRASDEERGDNHGPAKGRESYSSNRPILSPAGVPKSELETKVASPKTCESCHSVLDMSSETCATCKRSLCSFCLDSATGNCQKCAAQASLLQRTPSKMNNIARASIDTSSPPLAMATTTTTTPTVREPVSLKPLDVSLYQSKLVQECFERIKASENAIKAYEKQILQKAKKDSETPLENTAKERMDYDRMIRKMQKEPQVDKSTLDAMQDKLWEKQTFEHKLLKGRFFPPELKWKYHTTAGDSIYVGVRDMTMEKLAVKFKATIKNQQMMLQMDTLKVRVQLYHMRLKAGSASKQMLMGMLSPEHLGLELKNDSAIVLPLSWSPSQKIWRVVEEGTKFKLSVERTIQTTSGATPVPHKLLNWLINTFLPKLIKKSAEKFMLEELATLFNDQANEATFQGECTVSSCVSNEVFTANLSESSAARSVIALDLERSQLLSDTLAHGASGDLKTATLDALTRYMLRYSWCDKLWPQLLNDWEVLCAVCLRARIAKNNGKDAIDGFMKSVFASVDAATQRKECDVSLAVSKLDLNIALQPAMNTVVLLLNRYVDRKRQRQQNSLKQPKKPGQPDRVIWTEAEYAAQKQKVRRLKDVLATRYRFLIKHLNVLTLVCAASFVGGFEAQSQLEVQNLTFSGVIPRWHKNEIGKGHSKAPPQPAVPPATKRSVASVRTEYTQDGEMVVEIRLDGHRWDPQTRAINPHHAHVFVYQGTVQEIATTMKPSVNLLPQGIVKVASLKMKGPLEPLVRIGSLLKKTVKWRRVSDLQSFLLPYLLLDQHAFRLSLGIAVRVNRMPSEVDGKQELFLQIGTDHDLSSSSSSSSSTNSTSSTSSMPPSFTSSESGKKGWNFSIRLDVLEFFEAFWGTKANKTPEELTANGPAPESPEISAATSPERLFQQPLFTPLRSVSSIECLTVRVSFQSHGVRCVGTLSVPAESTKLSPVVILAHGLGCWAEFEPIPTLRRACLTRGLSTLTFDYRSFGLSDGQPRAKVDLVGQVEDWVAAVQAISSRQLLQLGNHEIEHVEPLEPCSQFHLRLVAEVVTPLDTAATDSDHQSSGQPAHLGLSEAKELEPLLSDSSLSLRIDRTRIALCGVSLGGGHVIKAAADRRVSSLGAVKAIVSIEGCMDFNIVNGAIGERPGFCSRLATGLCGCCMGGAPLVPETPGDEFAATLRGVIQKAGRLSASGNGDGVRYWKDGKITKRQLARWRASYRPLDAVCAVTCAVCLVGLRQDGLSPFSLLLEAWQRRGGLDELWVGEGTHSACYEGSLKAESAWRQALFLERHLT